MKRYDPAFKGEMLSVRFLSEARRSSSKREMNGSKYDKGRGIGSGAIAVDFEPKLNSNSAEGWSDS